MARRLADRLAVLGISTPLQASWSALYPRAFNIALERLVMELRGVAGNRGGCRERRAVSGRYRHNRAKCAHRRHVRAGPPNRYAELS
jgi:hypothetical protein